jgi:hypothetical protein
MLNDFPICGQLFFKEITSNLVLIKKPGLLSISKEDEVIPSFTKNFLQLVDERRYLLTN